MQKQIGKVGTIHREVRGKACASCGGHTYQVRLSPGAQAGVIELLARCTQCHRANNIGDNLGNILWM